MIPMLNFIQFIQQLDEGVNDPAIFKAVFLAGGPGSGKSFMVGQSALTAHGFKIVNSDTAFEKAMDKAGLELNPDDIFSAQGQAIRDRSKQLTGKQLDLYLTGRLGVVIDGTGRDSAKILRMKNKIEQLGYETAMVFVNTDLETAVLRDSQRSRSLGEKAVTDMWKEVQKNLGKFQSAFGSNFFIADNSEGSNFRSEAMRVYKGVGAWSKKPPRNKKAQDWIRSQKR